VCFKSILVGGENRSTRSKAPRDKLRSTKTQAINCRRDGSHKHQPDSSRYSQMATHQVTIPDQQNFGQQTGPGPVSRKSRNFSAEIIIFVSSKRRCSESRNLAVTLSFIPLTTYEKTSFTEKAGRSFTNGFSGSLRLVFS